MNTKIDRDTEREGKKRTKNVWKKEWKRNLERRRLNRERERRDRGDEEEQEGVREDSRIGMETRYAIGMGSHACVPSSPAGGERVLFFFLRLFLLLSYRPFHCSVRYLSLSLLSLPSAALQLSIRCQSVNFSFCLQSPHLPPHSLPSLRFDPEFRRLF